MSVRILLHRLNLSDSVFQAKPLRSAAEVKGNAVLIAGEKSSRHVRGDSTFHLVERGFGRFVRSVRLVAPCDGANARATLDNGELRVTLPKIGDRRRRAIHVPVAGGKPVM